MNYLRDEPTLEDALLHASHISRIGNKIKNSEPPLVIAIHGDWGSGKTSFLKKLRLFIAAESEPQEVSEVNDIGELLWASEFAGTYEEHNCTTVWFDAWKYQFDTNPVVALLNEIRARLSFWSKTKDKTKKGFFAGLMALDKLTEQLGGFSVSKIQEAGEKWEHRHLQTPLESQVTKTLLSEAIEQLLGGKDQKLVIFIDDLDRCQSAVAFKMLEILKIYFSIPNCIFVLGIDWRNTRRAVASELKSQLREDGAINLEPLASDYLEKICQVVERVPVVRNCQGYLKHLGEVTNSERLEKWSGQISRLKMIPPNPRKLKMFANEFNSYFETKRGRFGNDVGHLILCVIWLKTFAQDVFATLQSDVDFWPEIVKFSEGESSDIAVLQGFDLPFIRSGESEFKSTFLYPSREGVFWIAKAIQHWKVLVDSRDQLTNDEFKKYVVR